MTKTPRCKVKNPKACLTLLNECHKQQFKDFSTKLDRYTVFQWLRDHLQTNEHFISYNRNRQAFEFVE